MSDNLTDTTGTDSGSNPPIIAGNYTDDDAEYIDDLFGNESTPPEYDELPTGPDTLPDFTAPPGPLRLQAVTGTYALTSGAIRVLSKDPNRVNATVTVTNNAAYVSDTPDNLTTTGFGICFYIPANTSVDIPHFTGALFIAPAPSGESTWTFSVLAVTE